VSAPHSHGRTHGSPRPSPSLSLPEDLLRDLIALSEGPLDRPLPDDDFDGLARRVFAWQFASNPIYRVFCEGRGVTPDTWRGWEAIPAVPTRGFKELDLISGDPGRVERVFRTSGTSRGAGRRGRHHVPSLELYRRLSLPWLRANLLPDLEPGGRIRIIALVSEPARAPESSLSTMVGFAVDAFGDAGSAWVADPETGLDLAAATAALEAAEGEGRPTLLVGTAFAFVHLVDALDERGASFALPHGSRAMETGGFKGRSRTVAPDELYEGIARVTGVPAGRIVNEYGMTELLSQFWEPVLREGSDARRRHVAPPWMRTRILAPDTLHPAPAGAAGLLQHLDLANLGSVSAVLTEDTGRAVGDGFVVLGRTPGAEPRGCSLAMDELMGGGA
jgi:hypothetical protein